MAIIADKVEFIQSVATIVDADTTMGDMFFPVNRFHTTELIQYDTATVEGVAPEYTSFSETARVIKKDGKDTVTVAPVNFNDAISKETIDADATQFGQNVYGTGTIDPVVQAALTGIGKHHLNAMVGRKKLQYEVLTTGKIAGGYIGKNGPEDIVFPIPSANIEVFDGTTLKYWSNSASTPLDDMYRMWAKMKVRPTAIIMNDVTYSNLYANAQVLTMDNATTGKKRNFVINENVAEGAYFFKAGTVMYKGMVLAVYVENQMRKLANGSYTPFCPTGYISYLSANGEMHFGGIPMAGQDGVTRISAEFDVTEIIEQNPPQHLLQYRSAPLPVLKNGEAYGIQHVEA